MIANFSCQVDEIWNQLTRLWICLWWFNLDQVKWSEKTCPLWVAQFPGLGFQTVGKAESELNTNIYPFLLPDYKHNVSSHFRLLIPGLCSHDWLCPCSVGGNKNFLPKVAFVRPCCYSIGKVANTSKEGNLTMLSMHIGHESLYICYLSAICFTINSISSNQSKIT